MGKKIRIFFVIVIFLSVTSYGLISLSNNLPKFIKDDSKIKVNYGEKPYEINIDMGDYIIYTKSDVFSDIKQGVAKGFNRLKEKTEVTFQNFKEKAFKGIERVFK